MTYITGVKNTINPYCYIQLSIIKIREKLYFENIYRNKMNILRTNIFFTCTLTFFTH